jgi:hypothetical protein
MQLHLLTAPGILVMWVVTQQINNHVYDLSDQIGTSAFLSCSLFSCSLSPNLLSKKKITEQMFNFLTTVRTLGPGHKWQPNLYRWAVRHILPCCYPFRQELDRLGELSPSRLLPNSLESFSHVTSVSLLWLQLFS